MKSIYKNLARNALSKNKIVYVPYIISSIMMITISFIIFNLAVDKVIGGINGGASLQMMMGFGIIIMYMISFFFLNSVSRFVIKQRKKELGLYSVLGMQKKHIMRVQFIENLYVYILSAIPGTIIGVVISKILQLMVLKIYNCEADFGWEINPLPILINLAVFGFFYLLFFLINCISILRTNSLEYMKEEAKGEKKPKSNWFLAIVGILLLGGGYALAIRSQSALDAFSFFFFAVSLVILGTICLFTAGSITLLNTLKKKKDYYYKTGHFISVSGMLYRMKRNASTLATICIFATMVLVTISSVMTLYSTIRTRAEEWYRVDFDVVYETCSDEQMQENIEKLKKGAEKIGMNIDQIIPYKYYNAYANFKDGVLLTYPAYPNTSVIETFTLSLDLYNLVNKSDVTLEKDQIGYFVMNGPKISGEISYQTVNAAYDQYSEKSKAFTLVELDEAPQFSYGASITLTEGTYFFVAPDQETLDSLRAYFSQSIVEYEDARIRVLVNTDADEETQQRYYDEINTNQKDYGFMYAYSRLEDLHEVIGIYGGLFFLGIFLSIAFLTITILNMYFSQLLQGYEDTKRFAIMRKVGLSRKEIRKSINSQIVIVFLLPLLVAVIHTMAAFPMVNRILMLLGGCKPQQFLIILGACVAVFAVVYTIAYFFTRRTYLKLVSGAKQ